MYSTWRIQLKQKLKFIHLDVQSSCINSLCYNGQIY